MKRVIVLIIAIASLLIAGCGEGKKEEVIVKKEPPKPAAPPIPEPKPEPKKENPAFLSFMDQKWGTDAETFIKTFKFKESTIPYADGFMLKDFKLAEMKLSTVAFIFKSKKENLLFEKKNYSDFFFDRVYIKITPEQFEALYDIFKIKYGEAKIDEVIVQNKMGDKFVQKTTDWEEGDRKILLLKYGDKLDQGYAYFLNKKVDKKELEKSKEKMKKAADVL